MKSKEERLSERGKLTEEAKGKDWFSNEVSVEKFEEHFNKLIDTYTPEELLEELIECGLEIDKEEN